MGHQKFWKIFHDPHKTLRIPPPTYLMYGTLETQDISQNSSSARNGGDLSTTNYVWDTNNMNVSFQWFGNTTQSSYYKWNNFCFNIMFCFMKTLAKSIYLLTLQFYDLEILLYQSVATFFLLASLLLLLVCYALFLWWP